MKTIKECERLQLELINLDYKLKFELTVAAGIATCVIVVLTLIFI